MWLFSHFDSIAPNALQSFISVNNSSFGISTSQKKSA